MLSYKRNQVEDAIAKLHESSVVGTELRTRTKRLLDADRTLNVTSGSDDVELANFAFFTSSPPGKGGEVQFSEYESFALMIGLQMLGHRWPQGFVVATLRRLRPALEKEHRKIMKLDPAKVFRPAIGRPKPGTPAIATESAVFLLIWSDQRSGPNPAPSAEIFGDAQAAFRRTLEKPGRSSTWIELTRPAHLLSQQLSKSLPRRRGRT